MRVHLFPSRTQKLSSSAPTILAGQLAGKIGNANTMKSLAKRRGFFAYRLCAANRQIGVYRFVGRGYGPADPLRWPGSWLIGKASSTPLGWGLFHPSASAEAEEGSFHKNVGRIRTNFKCLSHASPCKQGRACARFRFSHLTKHSDPWPGGRLGAAPTRAGRKSARQTPICRIAEQMSMLSTAPPKMKVLKNVWILPLFLRLSQ